MTLKEAREYIESQIDSQIIIYNDSALTANLNSPYQDLESLE